MMLGIPFFGEIITGAFLVLLAFVILLNIFSLPGNWILLALVVAWKYFYPETKGLDYIFFAFLTAFAVLGELLEFGSQILKAKQYGSSSAGTFAGIVGAVIGAIMLAPFLFGLGALFGALLGAFVGSYLAERFKRPHKESLKAAFGAMTGRLLGTVCKCSVGIIMLLYTAKYIWPEGLPILPLPPLHSPPVKPEPTDMVFNLSLFFA